MPDSQSHYLAAERFLAMANSVGDYSSPHVRSMIAMAQVHALLADVADRHEDCDYDDGPAFRGIETRQATGERL